MKLPRTFEHHELHTTSSLSPSCGNNALHKGNKARDTRRRTTTVRISEDDNVVHEILPLCEYTPEEVRSCWFSRVEYNSFKRSSLITLNLNREGKLAFDDGERTMRGLECRTREVTDSRRAVREGATAAVMNEQFQQRRLDYWDPQAIADLYHSVSWSSQYTAYTQGLADEQDAQETSFEERFFGLGSNSQGAAVPASNTSVATTTTTNVTTKRNSVLSSIISIDERDEDALDWGEEQNEENSTPTIAGFHYDLWNNTSNATNEAPTTTASFNLNNFFNDVMSVSIAVGAA